MGEQTEKKTKLAFIMPLAYPLFNTASDVVFGGAEVDLHTLAVALAENPDYDITFYVGDFGQPAVEQYGRITVRRIKYLASKTKNSVWHKSVRHFAIWLAMLRCDADVFINETASELAGWVGLFMKRLKKRKYIHRLAHEDDTVVNKGRSRKSAFLYGLGLASADIIIAQTEIQREMLNKNLGYDSVIIKNGLFIPESRTAHKEDHLLWVARCTPFKRPKLLLELARRLPEVNFRMIMPLNHASSKELSSTLNTLNSDTLTLIKDCPNVKHIDYVPFYQIQEEYNRARLFVNTSINEGFPNAFVQACLGRTPILSFNVNPDDFIRKNQVGFCCEDDMDAAVAFIRNLTEEEANRMGDNALAYVKREHDITRIVSQYEALIHR